MIFGILSFIGIIMFIVFDSIIVNDVFETIMLAGMVGATIWSYYSIAKLDINPNPISFLDDLLLLICIPSYFLYGLLNIISGVDGDDLTSSVSTNMFMVSFVFLEFSCRMLKLVSDMKLFLLIFFNIGSLGHVPSKF